MPTANSAQSDAGRLCVGLMSGTSVDGIDAALVRITGLGAGARVDLMAFAAVPFPPDVRQAIFDLFEQRPGSVARLCALNFVVGEHFADAALEVCRRGGVETGALFVIGSHGQTIWHQPAADPVDPLLVPSTLQIGEPSVIAARTGATVVADFRVADLAVGGQGAPLVPYFDWCVLRHPERSRAIQNIGGIANVTRLPAGGGLTDVRAFDTGPGNMVVDGLVTLLTGGAQTFDQDGHLAERGTVDEALLAGWLRDPYLDQPPPKTTGRERYGLPFSRWLIAEAGLSEGVLAPGNAASEEGRQRARDLIATATALTARSIAEAYRRWLPRVDEVIVGGGGRRNPALMRMLAAALAPVLVRTHEEVGIDGDAKEAMAFALLAHDALLGRPTNVPGATGARRTVTLGKVVPVARRA